MRDRSDVLTKGEATVTLSPMADRTRLTRRVRARLPGGVVSTAALEQQIADVAANLQHLRDELAATAARLNEVELHVIAVADQRHQDMWNVMQIRHEHVLQLLLDLHTDQTEAGQIRHEHLVKLLTSRFRRPTA